MVIQEEQDAIYGYTVSYHNINEPLRWLTYYGSQTSAQLGLQRIPLIEGIINKSSYNFDMWLQRGDKLVALKKFGLANFSTATDAEIKALIGATGTEGAFWSMEVAKGTGFSGDVIFNIYAPRGTKMMYCEPFSGFGNGRGVIGMELSNSKLLDQRVKCYYNEGQRSRLQRLKIKWDVVYRFRHCSTESIAIPICRRVSI